MVVISLLLLARHVTYPQSSMNMLRFIYHATSLLDKKGIILYTLNHADKMLAIAPSLVDSLHYFAPERDIEVLGCVVDTCLFCITPNTDTTLTFHFCDGRVTNTS